MRNRFPRNCRIQLGSLENVVLLTGDRKFESISLQRRVTSEPLAARPQTFVRHIRDRSRSRRGNYRPRSASLWPLSAPAEVASYEGRFVDAPRDG